MHARVRLLALALVVFCLPGWGQEPAKQEPAKQELSREEQIKKLETDLTGATLLGRFTIDGREEQSPKPEEYTISSAVKLPEGDTWIISSRIKYGNKDVSIPVPVEIKWAGDTPVITLTNLAIPGLGTFTSRVMLYEGRYAGTWQHGKVGGLMYGTIAKPAADQPALK